MGHEGFYNSLLEAMGNVVSAILMYVLQAAWLCQRLIDQDYRQNHGSRLSPVSDKENISLPVEMISPKTSIQKLKSQRQNAKTKKFDTSKYQSESTRSHEINENKRRRHHRHHHHHPHHHHQYHHHHRSQKPTNLSHPYLEDGLDSLTTTFEYVNGLGHTLGLRRAFSDINISSSCSEFKSAFCDTNQNYLSNGNIDETTLVSVSDQDFLRLIFNKGYVT